MALTLSVVSKVVDTQETDAVLQTFARSVTTAHIYGWSIIPISNTKARIVMLYD